MEERDKAVWNRHNHCRIKQQKKNILFHWWFIPWKVKGKKQTNREVLPTEGVVPALRYYRTVTQNTSSIRKAIERDFQLCPLVSLKGTSLLGLLLLFSLLCSTQDEQESSICNSYFQANPYWNVWWEGDRASPLSRGSWSTAFSPTPPSPVSSPFDFQSVLF